MSVSGISSSSLFDTESVQNNLQQAQQGFNNWARTCNREIFRRRSRISRRWRIWRHSPTRRRHRRAATPLRKPSANWLRICNRATCRRRSRTSTPSSRTSRTSARTNAKSSHARAPSPSRRRRIERNQPVIRPTGHGAAIGQSFRRATGLQFVGAAAPALGPEQHANGGVVTFDLNHGLRQRVSLANSGLRVT